MRIKIIVATLLILTILSYGANQYYWSHAITVTTAAQDSTFTVAWSMVNIHADTVDILYRVGAPDVGSWSSRDFIKLPQNWSKTFGPSIPLNRLEFKTVSGTGVLYFEGLKTSKQY